MLVIAVKENKLNTPNFFKKRELFEKNKSLYGASRKHFEKGQGWDGTQDMAVQAAERIAGKP